MHDLDVAVAAVALASKPLMRAVGEDGFLAGRFDATWTPAVGWNCLTGASQIALVIHERHFNRHDYLIWTEYGTVRPSYVLTYGGVPLVSVYVRP